MVIGRLDIGHYMSKEGEPRTSFDVWADEVQAMSPSRVPSGSEAYAADAEGEAAEPVAAGVSSLGGGSPGRAAANGKNGRAAARSEPAAAGEGASGQDLEDLPF
jgi:single-stranded DNA-binding protein